ncbi:hypothetical protein GYH30_022272 [Glycine max]|nr:hypothetical protein GYH30_022272 [Glycine max]
MESSSLIMNHCMSFIPSRSASDTIREILIADRCPCLFVYLSIVVSSEICTTGLGRRRDSEHQVEEVGPVLKICLTGASFENCDGGGDGIDGDDGFGEGVGGE